MASADELLRDAQYAVHSITYDDSRENRSHIARARSLARKIISKYPTSIEAAQARSMLDRLDGKAQQPTFSKLRPGVGEAQRSPNRPVSAVEVFHQNHKVAPVLAKGIADPVTAHQNDAQFTTKPRVSDALSEYSRAGARKSDGAKPDGQKLLSGFLALSRNKQTFVVMGIAFITVVVGFFPAVLALLVIFLAGPLEKSYPSGLLTIINWLIKSLDNWLEANREL